MEQKKFTKKQLLGGALATALAYGLFGPVGAICVVLFYVWRSLP